MTARSTLRRLFALLVVLSVLTVGVGYATGTAGTTFERRLADAGATSGDTRFVPPREAVTVVATDSNSWLGRASEGPRARAELVAFAPDGTLLYYDDSHTRYWDVDPVPGTGTTVEYMFSDHLDGADCPTDWNLSSRRVAEDTWEEYADAQADVDACTRNGVERVNLTTGEVTRVWTQTTPGKESTRYHDADRLNETHLVVADIYLDRVFVVDTRSGRVEWTWNASDHFSTDAGGPYPDDWTHINDVEALADGRIMVSVRNHDQVLFLDRSSGVIEGWTLGDDGDHGVVYEQHNPDYVPVERGGPAVVVADSENNRLVEYQRADGEWERTWVWRDARLTWPRDADRLPNGHTLVADSNGNRVVEIDEAGRIVWSVEIAFPYEVERLGTGDESAGGPSARRAELDSHRGSLGGLFPIVVKQVVPGRYLNGIAYVTPTWMGTTELVAVLVGVLVLVVWIVAELAWWVGPRWRPGG